MTRLRLGEIRFINALPLALPHTSLAGVPVEHFRRSPTELNRAVLNNEVDITPVSSACYLRNQNRLTLLDNIAIGAENPVESVLLFLPRSGFAAITPETTVYIPNTSETSVALLRYLLSLRLGQKSHNPLKVYSPGQGATLVTADHPVLAIGDEALTLRSRFAQGRFQVVDLAEAWQEETGLPFVFAVWVARNDFAHENPELLALVNQLLITQKKLFEENPEIQSGIISEAHQRCTQLDRAQLHRYYTRALSYHLDAPHLSALQRFEEILRWLDYDSEHTVPRYRSELPLQFLPG